MGYANIVADDKFPMGQLFVTRGVNDRVADDEAFAEFVLASLKRHVSADWGGMCKEDKQANDEALKAGDGRLFSAYESGSLPKIWIITEWDRSVTTVLFPSEY